MKKVTWNIPTTEVLDLAVEKVVESGVYSSKSELVRDAVRRRLKDLGFDQGVA